MWARRTANVCLKLAENEDVRNACHYATESAPPWDQPDDLAADSSFQHTHFSGGLPLTQDFFFDGGALEYP